MAETPLAFNLVSVRSSSGSKTLTVDAWTQLRYPFTRRLVKGTRVQVVATRCVPPNATSAVLVARRIDLR